MTRGETWQVSTILEGCVSTDVFLRPRLDRPLDSLLGVNPPAFAHIAEVLQRKVVQMDQKPLRFLLGRFRLVRLKRANVEFRRVDHLTV